MFFSLSCLFSGSLGPRFIPGPLRSPKHRHRPEQQQSHSSDDEQKWQVWKWWAHTRQMTPRTLFVHLNCQSTSGSGCLCTCAWCDPVCTHNMSIGACSIVHTERKGAASPVLFSKNSLYVSLHFCLYVVNNGRKGVINLVFQPNQCFSCAKVLTLELLHWWKGS